MSTINTLPLESHNGSCLLLIYRYTCQSTLERAHTFFFKEMMTNRRNLMMNRWLPKLFFREFLKFRCCCDLVVEFFGGTRIYFL